MEWLVLRCAPAKTLQLASGLAGHGAWTPTWNRRRRMPRSPITRTITEPCIPSFVFIPSSSRDLPEIPRVPFSFMRNHESIPVRIADREMEPLRQIADRPLVRARDLPRPGQTVRFKEGPWEGLTGKIIACTQRYAKINVTDDRGISQVIQAPPCLLSSA